MWNAECDFPSVEDPGDDYEIPELNLDWSDWWEDSTLPFKPPYKGEYEDADFSEAA